MSVKCWVSKSVEMLRALKAVRTLSERKALIVLESVEMLRPLKAVRTLSERKALSPWECWNVKGVKSSKNFKWA